MIETLLSLGAGLPVYIAVTKFFLKKRPVVVQPQPSRITPILDGYRQQQAALESWTPPAALEQTPERAALPAAPTVLEENYTKWANARVKAPLVAGGVAVLKALSDMSALQLSVEERHNLEVLSNHTVELLTNYFNTPETIRAMPEVEAALSAQLLQIEQSVGNVKVSGAENVIRNLNIGTEFIRTKFNPEEGSR